MPHDQEPSSFSASACRALTSFPNIVSPIRYTDNYKEGRAIGVIFMLEEGSHIIIPL